MRTQVLGFLLIGVVAACNGGGSNSPVDGAITVIDAVANDAIAIDAVVIDAVDIDAAAATCNPLEAAGQQGCATGQKCTWIELQGAPDELGRLGCVPDGTVALGAACTRGAAGETTGFDNCAAGGICIGSATAGVCKDLCGFDGGAVSACDAGSSCTRYAGLGANGDEAAVVGACNPTCDPLKQTRIVNGASVSCGTGQGCYLLASTIDTIAVCAGAGIPTHNQPISGTTYANSCAPGHVPRVAVQGQPGNECAALCKPADVYMGNNEAYEGGDTRETNFMMPPQPATCESAGGPSVAPAVPTTGESCTFYWTREPSTNLTSFSNTLGWCFNHASWAYDPDGMEPVNNTAAYPRCITLTTGDVVPPIGTDPMMPQNDALYFGCMALPAMFTTAALDVTKWKRRHEPRLDRLGAFNR